MGIQLTGRAVVPLDTEHAKDPAVPGAKASNPARSAIAGLPVLPGFVLASADRRPVRPSGRRQSVPPGRVSPGWTTPSGHSSSVLPRPRGHRRLPHGGAFASVLDGRG